MTEIGSGTVLEEATLVSPEREHVEPLPETIGPYRVLDLLGEGNMGRVYRCFDATQEREVAVKLLSPRIAKDPDCLRRFEREVRVATKLEHPNTVPVLAHGRHGQLPFLVMECVVGTSLAERVNRAGFLAPGEALRITRHAARGLSAAKASGLVHRDVKPSNILLTPDGGVRVADFGLAKPLDKGNTLTTTGIVVGTPQYMSPEQAAGLEIDHRSDMYSLGITLYHMLTGAPPFTDGSPLSVAMQHVQGDFPRLQDKLPGQPPELYELLDRLTARDPADRYYTWEQAINAISAAGRSLRTRRSQPTPAPRSTAKQSSPRAPWLLIAGGVTLALVLGLGMWLLSGSDAPLAQVPATPALTSGGAPEPIAAPEPPPVVSAEPARDWAWERSYAFEDASQLGDFTQSRMQGTDRDALPARLTLGRLSIPPRSATELWHGATLSGDKEIELQLKLDQLARGNQVLIQLRDTASRDTYMLSLGWQPAGRSDDGKRFVLEGPSNKLYRVGLERELLSANRDEILSMDRNQTITLRHQGGKLSLLKDGATLLESEVPELAEARFGLAFPSGGAWLDELTLRADAVE